MSTHNICFLLTNKKDISIFWMKKSALSVAMIKMKSLSSAQHSESMGHTKAGNYRDNSPNCAKTELIQDLCWFSLSASLTKIISKKKSLSSGHHFLHCMSNSV